MIKENNISKYSMHKYWGKKPASGITPLIDKYSNYGDTVIDPFAGYGVFCCEAFLKNRNVIINDLNPIANFIAKNLFSSNINISKVKKEWIKIKSELQAFVNDWYRIIIAGENYYPISVLRTKDGTPIQFSYKIGNNKMSLMDIPKEIAAEFCSKEDAYIIDDWYPKDDIIENSRISAFPNMKIADLFTKRTLACHAKLYSLINRYSDGEERNLFLMAFTANLANCSKLVPPIKTRGTLSQGAWMTGFYVGNTFIENNVLHYYENRLNKAIKGKEDYYQCLQGDLIRGSVKSSYTITTDDAKRLNLPNDSVDYVFTDPPYGDSVPYFEQSIIWNSWLKKKPDYNREIVVSNSNKRDKRISTFENDINSAFSEIRRILKDNRYFSLTFHSLSGLEWKSVSNACVFNNFNVVEYEWLEQKTYPPRQLNRLKSIKGDVLVTLIKNPNPVKLKYYDDEHLSTLAFNFIKDKIISGCNTTNEIMMSVMEWILREMIVVGDIDIFKILNSNFAIDKEGCWSLK